MQCNEGKQDYQHLCVFARADLISLLSSISTGPALVIAPPSGFTTSRGRKDLTKTVRAGLAMEEQEGGRRRRRRRRKEGRGGREEVKGERKELSSL
eukprot:405695-Hanusia_phi.AAC.1